MNSGAGRWITGLAGLGLIGAAVWVFVGKSSGMEEKRAEIRGKGRRIAFLCTNPACRASGKRHHVTFDETYPTVCPKCAKKTAVRGFVCTRTRCKRIFRLVERPVFDCPHCGKHYERMAGRMLRPRGARQRSGAASPGN
jgi:hypothetical protein